MPKYRVELRRMRPGKNNSIRVEHASHEVEANSDEEAREAGGKALAENKGIEWTDGPDGVKSGEGVGHVVSVAVQGPKAGVMKQGRSPIVRAVQDIPVKTPGGALARSQDDSSAIVLDQGLSSQTDPLKPNYELHEGDDPHPDDSEGWQAQSKRNAEVANPS